MTTYPQLKSVLDGRTPQQMGEALAALAVDPSVPKATSVQMDRHAAAMEESSYGCYRCGKGTKKENRACSRCLLAWYCSRDCQAAHWKVHKKVCKKDSSKETVNIAYNLINFDHQCRHGGPKPIPEVFQVIPVMLELGWIKKAMRDDAPMVTESTDQRFVQLVNLLGDFCVNQPVIARSGDGALLLVSMSADAFRDRRYGESRYFCTFAMFLEAYAMEEGSQFLHDLQDTNTEMQPGLKYFVDTQRQINTINGLYDYIKSHLKCKCLDV
jgi:hypothetical protein